MYSQSLEENTACTLDSTHLWTTRQVQGSWALLSREERRERRSLVSSDIGDPRLLEGVGKVRKSRQSKEGQGPLGFASSFTQPAVTVSAKTGGTGTLRAVGGADVSEAQQVMRCKPEPYLLLSSAQPFCPTPPQAIRAQFKGGNEALSPWAWTLVTHQALWAPPWLPAALSFPALLFMALLLTPASMPQL